MIVRFTSDATAAVKGEADRIPPRVYGGTSDDGINGGGEKGKLVEAIDSKDTRICYDNDTLAPQVSADLQVHERILNQWAGGPIR